MGEYYITLILHAFLRKSYQFDVRNRVFVSTTDGASNSVSEGNMARQTDIEDIYWAHNIGLEESLTKNQRDDETDRLPILEYGSVSQEKCKILLLEILSLIALFREHHSIWAKMTLAFYGRKIYHKKI